MLEQRFSILRSRLESINQVHKTYINIKKRKKKIFNKFRQAFHFNELTSLSFAIKIRICVCVCVYCEGEETKYTKVTFIQTRSLLLFKDLHIYFPQNKKKMFIYLSLEFITCFTLFFPFPKLKKKWRNNIHPVLIKNLRVYLSILIQNKLFPPFFCIFIFSQEQKVSFLAIYEGGNYR